MNTSKLDTSKTSLNQSTTKKEKNIREIYLQALNHNKSFQKTIKKPGLSNLSEDRNANNGSSHFLEKEYNIVQRIISDTKELKNIKIKDHNNKDTATKEAGKQIASRYKDPEEYYKEILELKRTLKVYEENEVISRTKFEYYENELAKKEQEIMDLLDIKKTEQLRLLSDSKADLATLIYSLKQKIFKLEFSLKRKENEFNKLKNEIKTTNIKELQLQNERLRLELSKALIDDKEIIDNLENKSNYELDKIRNESQLSFKKNLDKKNVAVSINSGKDKNSSIHSSPKFSNFDSKIALSGSLRDKLDQLNQRETELLFEISRLNMELDKNKIKKKIKNSDSETESVLNSTRGSVRSNRSSRQSKRSSNLQTEKEKLNSIKLLQSVMRGHMERSSSLKRAEQEKIERRRSKSRSPSWRSPSPRPRSRSPPSPPTRSPRRE
ncbi:IQ domain-containing E-like isoform X6, partial [Brachionus plicatilis]